MIWYVQISRGGINGLEYSGRVEMESPSDSREVNLRRCKTHAANFLMPLKAGFEIWFAADGFERTEAFIVGPA